MTTYKVLRQQRVWIEYEGTIEAESLEQARQLVDDGEVSDWEVSAACRFEPCDEKEEPQHLIEEL